MASVIPIRPDFDQIDRLARKVEDVAHGGGGGDNTGMEARVKSLEEAVTAVSDRLTKIEARLEHMPTKADLSDAMNSQIKWIVGTAAVLGGAAIVVMTFVLNNASPKPGAGQPPIIINVPASIPAPPPPPAAQ